MENINYWLFANMNKENYKIRDTFLILLYTYRSLGTFNLSDYENMKSIKILYTYVYNMIHLDSIKTTNIFENKI